MMESIKIGEVGQLSQNKVINKETQQEATRFEEKDTPLSIIACKITMYNPNHDKNLHIFLCANNIKYTISDAMTDLWPYGRVIKTSTGYHGEFYRKNDEFRSLMYLGKKRNEVIRLMYRIVSQNIYIDMQQ